MQEAATTTATATKTVRVRAEIQIVRLILNAQTQIATDDLPEQNKEREIQTTEKAQKAELRIKSQTIIQNQLGQAPKAQIQATEAAKAADKHQNKTF